jgi:hypothetical protein
VSKIVIGKSGKDLAVMNVGDLLRTHLLIWASTGGGKSWLIRRLAEQLFGKVPVIIVDREGEYPSLREKFGYVLVGPGGETPADVRSAKLVAETLLKIRASAVCDLYELSHESRAEWVKQFVGALLDAPKKLWGPTVIIIDEAHLFCPEKGQGESVAYGVVADLAGQGRKRGFGVVLATQRLSKLSKNATGEMYNQAAGPTARQADRDRAAYEMGISGKSDIKEFSDALRTLDPGNFFFQGRAISMDRILVKVGAIQTTHPEAGVFRRSAKNPPLPQKVKALLPKLADLPKEAEEKAQTESRLRSEIRTLKAQLRSQLKSAPVVIPVRQAVERADIDRAVREAEKEFRGHIQNLDSALRKQTQSLAQIAKMAAGAAEIKIPELKLRNIPKLADIYHPRDPRPIVVSPRESLKPPRSTEEKLRSGAERMLAALAQWHPGGMTYGQMRSHAGLKKSGTFSAYMTDLRRGGYIEERGGEVYATDVGLEYCKHAPPAPQSTEEVVAIWNQKLRDGARRMLEVLVKAGGEPIDKESLGERAGLVKSGTFSAYLSDLKTARLAVVNRDGTVAANRETLFL